MCENRPCDNIIKQIQNSSQQLSTTTITESDDDFTWPVPYVCEESEDNVKMNENNRVRYTKLY